MKARLHNFSRFRGYSKPVKKVQKVPEKLAYFIKLIFLSLNFYFSSFRTSQKYFEVFSRGVPQVE